MIKVKGLGAALLVALVTVGCSGTGGLRPQSVAECDWNALERNSTMAGPAIVAIAYDSISNVPFNAVSMSDNSLSRDLIVQTIASNRTPMDTVRVSARFMNCTNNRLHVRMRTNFLGGEASSAMPVEPVSAWQDVFLPPGAMTTYMENSISRDVEYFIVEVGRP